MERSPRRRILVSGGATLVAMVTAGCLGGSDSGGSDGDGESTTTETGTSTTNAAETTRAEPTDTTTRSGRGGDLYRDWVPAPSTLGVDHYEVSYRDWTTLREHRDALRPAVGDPNRGPPAWFRSQFGVSPMAITRSLDLGVGHQVVTGDFDPGAVVETLTGNGYADAGTHGRIRLFESDRGVAGVADETLLYVDGGAGRGPMDAARGLVETGVGDAEGYAAASDDYRAAVDPLGSVDVMRASTRDPAPEQREFDGLVGGAFGWRVAGRVTDATLTFVFDRPDRATPDAVREQIENSRLFDAYDEVSLRRKGRTVVASSSVPTREFDMLRRNRSANPPEVNFEFDYDADAGTVTVTHHGGDNVTTDVAGGLVVGVEGPDGSEERSKQWSLPVRAGDGETVEVSAGDRVVVIWVSPDGGETDRLAAYQVPA